MIEDLTDNVSLKRQLDEAEAALKAFEDGVTRRMLVARLRADNPLHPVLWMGRATLGLFSVLLLAALAWTAVVALGLPVPEQLLALLESNATFPGPMLLAALALCALAASAGMNELAAEIGADRPLMKDESRVKQKLTSEVMRLRAALKVEKRLSDTPVPAPSAQWAVVA